MNLIIAAINGNRIASAPGYRVKRTGHGTGLDIEVPQSQPGPPGANIQQYKIALVSDDYIEARTWDGLNLGASAIQIAKPWRLRKTGWDGVTVTYDFNGVAYPIRYTYSATRPGYRTALNVNTNQTENQAIIPVYSINDIIDATEPDGGTLATVAGTALTWLDLNVDARAWARY